MKAVIALPNGSAYAHLNGHTFDVHEILSNIIVLDIEGVKTDFGHSEVIIVDFPKEMQLAYDMAAWNVNELSRLHNLKEYQEKHEIDFTPNTD